MEPRNGASPAVPPGGSPETSSTPQDSTTLAAAALTYAERLGWKVFPLPGGKEPSDRARTYLTATADPDQIRCWWTEHPDAWVAVACRPSGLLVIDVDPRNGGDRALAALESEHGPLPRTCVQRSGSGGLHILMADPSPGPDGWTRTHETGGSCRGKFPGGVDVKLNGHVVVYPSGQYQWESLTLPVPEVPAAWQALLKKPECGECAASVASWADTIDGAIAPSDADKLRAELAALPPRGKGESTTFKAVMAVHHGYGLSVAEGRPYLDTWDRSNGKPLGSAELDRQVERVAEKVTEDDGPRGCRRMAGSPLDLIARAWVDPDSVSRVDSVDPVASVPVVTAAATDAPRRAGVRAVDLVGKIVELSKIPPVATKFRRLNEKIGGGFTPATANLLIGPTGSGKTSLGIQIGADHAETGPTVFYGGEMLREQLVAKVVAQRTGRSWLEVLRGKVTEAEMRAVLAPLALHMIGPQASPIPAIAAELDALAIERPGETIMLVVDYVQLLSDVGKDMRLAVMDAMRQLLRLTEDRKLVTLALSQVARNNSDKIRSGDGKATDYVQTGAETSELERAAAAVLVISFDPQEDAVEHEATLFVAKGRGTGGSRIGLTLHGPSGLWREVASAPKPKAQQDRRAEIMETVEAHARGECDCRGQTLTATKMTRAGTHKVRGHHTVVKKEVADMIAAKPPLLRRDPDFGIRPAQEPTRKGGQS